MFKNWPSLIVMLVVGMVMVIKFAPLLTAHDAAAVPQETIQAAEPSRAHIVMQLGLGPAGVVGPVTLSPDQRFVLVGYAANRVRLWDRASGHLIRTFTGPGQAAAFSPDGRLAVSGGGNEINVWDIASGRERVRFTTDPSTFSVALSPDGRTVLSGGSRIDLWDIASGQKIRTFTDSQSGLIYSVGFSPDGRTALSGNNDKVNLWDVASGQMIRTLTGHSSVVQSVAFSPDGQTALSTGGPATKVWDVASGRELWTYGKHRYAASFSPDGKFVLLANIIDVTIRDAATGRELNTVINHDPLAYVRVYRAARLPDGSDIILAGGNKSSDVELRDVSPGRAITTLRSPPYAIASVAFSPDGRIALLGGCNDREDVSQPAEAIRLLDLATGREIRALNGHSGCVKSVAFLPDGHTALSGSLDSTLKLWDIASGREIRTFSGHSEAVHAVAVSPDGRLALSGGMDSAVKLWNIEDGQERRTFTGHRGAISAVAFSPDGQSALSAGLADGMVTLWDIATGREIRTFEPKDSFIFSVAFSPDGHTMLSGSSNRVTLWDVASGRRVMDFKSGGGAALSVAFSPDGRSVVSGHADGTVRLWEVTQTSPDPGRGARTLVAHSASVNAIAVSPDGRTLLSGSEEGSIRLWERGTGEAVATSVPSGDGSWLAITPEGFYDSSSPQGSPYFAVIRGLDVCSDTVVGSTLYRPDLVREKLAGDPHGKVRAAAAQLDLDKLCFGSKD